MQYRIQHKVCIEQRARNHTSDHLKSYCLCVIVVCVLSIAPQHIGKPHLSLYTLTIASSSSALGKNTNDDFILSMITWKTSLTQIQTNNGETLNKFAIVRYSAVLAR